MNQNIIVLVIAFLFTGLNIFARSYSEQKIKNCSEALKQKYNRVTKIVDIVCLAILCLQFVLILTTGFSFLPESIRFFFVGLNFVILIFAVSIFAKPITALILLNAQNNHKK